MIVEYVYLYYRCAESAVLQENIHIHECCTHVCRSTSMYAPYEIVAPKVGYVDAWYKHVYASYTIVAPKIGVVDAWYTVINSKC